MGWALLAIYAVAYVGLVIGLAMGATLHLAGGWVPVEEALYRYQTLIAGGAALVAALIAVRPVYQQVKRMRSQIALQTVIVLRDTISAIEEQNRLAWLAVRAAKGSISAEQVIAKSPTSVGLVDAASDAYKKAHLATDELIEEIGRSITRESGSVDVVLTRGPMMVALAELGVAFTENQRVLINIKFALVNHPPHQKEWIDADAAMRRLSCAPIANKLETAAQTHIDALSRERLRLAGAMGKAWSTVIEADR
jgi:hypothetical protein